MSASSTFTPGSRPDDARFRCASCGREYWLAFGDASRTDSSHATMIGGRAWCDRCAAARFRVRRNYSGDILGDSVVDAPRNWQVK